MIEKIKNSISLKIVFGLISIVIVMGIIVLQIGNRTAINNITFHYKIISDVIMTFSEQKLSAIDDEENAEELKVLADEFRKFCDEYIINRAIVAIHCEEGKGRTVIDISKDHWDVIGASDFDPVFELTDYEKEVFDNKIDHSYRQYESERYGNGIEICRLFDYHGEEGSGMIVLIVDNDLVHDHSRHIMYYFWGILISILILVQIVTGIMLRVWIINPIRIISNSMNSFIENGKMEREKIRISGKDEIGQTAEAFNTMTEKIRDYVEQVKVYEGIQQQQKAELDIAFQIQKGFLPDEVYSKDPFAARGFMQPARNVGGDFYFYERIDEDRFAFAIGDVAGKGISAAMFMANVMASIKYNFRMSDRPSKVLEMINNDLAAENPEMVFVTIFAGIFNARNMTFTYSNAGHNPPYLINHGIIHQLTQGKGIFVGVFKGETYEDAEISVDDDDYIFLYTDGVTEAVNNDGKFFGKKRLEDTLQNKYDNVITEVYEEIQKFTEGAVQNDDITMLGVKLKNNNKRILPARADSIRELKDFIVHNDKIKEGFRKKIYLAAEEVFVNIYSYGYPDGRPGTVEIKLSASEKGVTMRFIDDADQFDPLRDVREADSYDPDSEIGGLGRLLAFQIMDEAGYEYSEGKNILTMKKYYE